MVTFQGKPGKWVVEELYSLSTGFRMVRIRRGKYQVKHLAQARIHSTSKVHRPTPSGLVQVWPEVEGNGSTFKEALEATIHKYGDALARLAGTQEAEHDPN